MVPALATAQPHSRQEQIRFAEGATSATIKGKIRGYHFADYQLRATAGQTMSVDFKTSNLSAYFNVMQSGANEALFVGSINGNHFKAALPADGAYTIRVYLMRNAARRKETANYTLTVGITNETGSGMAPPDASHTPTAAAFDQTLELQGIRFHVTSSSDGAARTLRIIPSGLEIDNSPIVRTIDGSVATAEVADLNVDGSPEIYVFVSSPGRGSPGSLVAFAVNGRKSPSEIHLPPLAHSKGATEGYEGQDEFAVGENALLRRFPVYDGAGAAVADRFLHRPRARAIASGASATCRRLMAFLGSRSSASDVKSPASRGARAVASDSSI